jgi:hypothetical protein
MYKTWDGMHESDNLSLIPLNLPESLAPQSLTHLKGVGHAVCSQAPSRG